jgi:drug/metabolite transporter (DMT)-like permease
MSGTELAAGIACAAGAAACFDGAVAWQALEARREPQGPRLLIRLARRRRWVAATALAALGWPLQVAALSLAPLTLVQPTLAAGLVVLLVLGALVLHERVGPIEIGAAAAIIAGVAVLAWSAPERETSVSNTVALAISLGLLGALALLPLAFAGRGRLSTVGAGCAFAATGLTTKLVSDALAHGSIVPATAWAAATGVVVLAGLRDDMSALQLLPATRAAPAMLAIEIVVPVALAPVVAGESWASTPGGGAAVVAGIVLVLAGVVPLASATAVRALA